MQKCPFIFFYTTARRHWYNIYSCLAFVPRPCIISKCIFHYTAKGLVDIPVPPLLSSSVNLGGSLSENEALSEKDEDLHFIIKCKGTKTLETLYRGEHHKHSERGVWERRGAGLKRPSRQWNLADASPTPVDLRSFVSEPTKLLWLSADSQSNLYMQDVCFLLPEKHPSHFSQSSTLNFIAEHTKKEGKETKQKTNTVQSFCFLFLVSFLLTSLPVSSLLDTTRWIRRFVVVEKLRVAEEYFFKKSKKR